MKKILYSIYTGEFPNQSSGGPNNIIYKLIQNYNKGSYILNYLSSDLFIENINNKILKELRNKLSTKKKTALHLSEKSIFYRKIFGSDFYLPFHFFKKNKYYKSFSQKFLDYDIIHSQDSISLSLVSNKDKISKKIITVHSKGPLSDELKNMAKSEKLQNSIDRKLKEIELENVELADLVTFPSNAAKIYFENSLNLKLNRNKVRIIYNGIDFDKIQNINYNGVVEKYSIEKKGKQLLLLNIAAHTSEKNIDILLKVVAELKKKFNKDVLLINIGAEGDDTNTLKVLADELKINENIKFLGKLENNEVIKFLKATDIFIMTSDKVIFDLVVLEALACGTCCVVSNKGGNKEIIKDGENGFLINIDDVDSIAKKIISILPYKNKVQENAIKTARQFSVQKMVNEYFEVYESMLNGV